MLPILSDLILRNDRALKNVRYEFYNDRDIEIPAMKLFIEKHSKLISSVLDVGAHYSYFYYAGLIRKLLPGAVYDGIDLMPDPETAKILNHYFVGDFNAQKLEPYDLVTCVSTIEHCGVKALKCADYAKAQADFFRKLLALSRKYLFLSFPYGRTGVYEDEYANLTPELLKEFKAMTKGRFSKAFYYNEFPQGHMKWAAISEKEAGTVALDKSKGVQCLCALTVVK